MSSIADEASSSPLNLSNRRDGSSSVPFQEVELGGASENKETVFSSDESDEDKSETAEQHDASNTKKNRFLRCGFWVKVIIGLVLLGFIIFAIVDSTTTGHVRAGFESFLVWIENNLAAGFFVFVLVYFVATVLFIPGALLTLGAGFIFSMAFSLGWGIVIGTICVLLGASLGAIASFILGRFLLRKQIGKLSAKYTIFEALETAIQDNGLKIFVLLRLSPIIPFNAINYLGGLTSISFRDYLISLLAIIPGTLLYVFLGSSAGSLANLSSSGQDPTVLIIIIVVSAVFGIIALWLTTRYARKELNRIVALREAQADEVEDVEVDAESRNSEDENRGESVDNPTTDSTTPAVTMWDGSDP